MEPPPSNHVPVQPPKRRRRYRHWLILGLIIAILVTWWNWPRHYRIRDLAARLDREEPGWRYDDYVVGAPAVPDNLNGTKFLLANEASLPTSVAAVYRPIVTKLTSLPSADMLQARHLLSKEKLAEEFTVILRQTNGLRQVLPELLNYPLSRVEQVSFLSSRFGTIASPYPRVYDWWALHLLHWEEAFRGQDVPEMERRLIMACHYLLKQQAGMYPDLKQFCNDFCYFGYCLERQLAKHPISNQSLAKLEGLIQSLDWHRLEEGVLKRRRAIYHEMAHIYLDQWDTVYTKVRQQGSEPWYRLWYASMTRDDHIEGHTLIMEYQQLRLRQLRGDTSAAGELDALRQNVARYRRSDNDNFFTLAINQFRQSGRMTAYNLVTLFDGEHDALLEGKAMQRMLLAAIAIERYRQKTGKLPSDWNELIPAYLKEPPASPITPNKPIDLIKTDFGIRLDTGQRNKAGEPTRPSCFHILKR